MLGGGNPVGSTNPAGIGKTIAYYRTTEGTFVSGYSGEVTSTGSESNPQALLDFKTGSTTIVAEIEFSYPMETLQRGVNSIQLDGQIVAKQFFRFASNTYEDTFPMRFNIVIPPFTRVECLTGFEDSNGKQCVTITGRAYA